jgi:hypothetical protein
MTSLDDAAYAFATLLEELGLEYASDTTQPRFVVPTERGHGIVVELLDIDAGDATVPCAVLILPVLRSIGTPTAEAAQAAVSESASMLIGKLIVDGSRQTVEVRHEIPVVDLTASALSVVLGALSTHSAASERLELVFGGERGPSYDELLDGA